MTVSDILSAKGHNVITTGTDATLEEVSQLLAKHKVGAAVVVDAKNDVCGILSERDIVRQVAASGAQALGNPVSSCMTSKVITCNEGDTIDVAMQKMSDGRFRHLPVLTDGKLAGIISIGDVVKKKIEQAERDAADLKQYIAG